MAVVWRFLKQSLKVGRIGIGGRDHFGGRGTGGIGCESSPMTYLMNDLERAAVRRIRVLLKVYSNTTIPGCDTVRSEETASPVTSLPMQYVHLVMQGRHWLTAL